jgi:hypothetical protein
LFDGDDQAKAAFDSVIEVAAEEKLAASRDGDWITMKRRASPSLRPHMICQ